MDQTWGMGRNSARAAVKAVAMLVASSVVAHANSLVTDDTTQNGGEYQADTPVLRITGSSNPTLTLDNAATVNWNGAPSSATVVGLDDGESGSLQVLNGSTLTNAGNGSPTLNTFNGQSILSGYAYLGFLANSNGSATISGQDSRWENFVLNVGYNGTGDMLISNGGTVSVGLASYIGSEAGSQGTVTVTGAGSQLTVASVGQVGLAVGRSGSGVLNIGNGGLASSDYVVVGYSGGSEGVVNVTGQNSRLEAYTVLYVGQLGTGEVNVSNGGSVNNATAFIGFYGPGTVNVSGTGSSLTNSSITYVGYQGTGTLNVTGGATAHSQNTLYVGFTASGDGTVKVSGQGSALTTGASYMYIGVKGTGTLDIEDGANVSGYHSWIGNDVGSMGTVNVTGTNSKWTLSQTLSVGYSGTGELNITGGGSVSNSIARIGDQANSIGTAIVSGVSSTWTNSGALGIGWYGRGSLDISNGASVSNTDGQIGYQPGSSGTVTVSGAGSTWSNSGNLLVGWFGDGTVNVLNGGNVSNGIGYIAYMGGSEGRATVSGQGSHWSNSGSLTVGWNGSGELTIENGGKVSNTYGYIAAVATDSQGSVTVTGTGSQWNSSSDLYVGLAGTATLDVTNGGSVSSNHAFIGVNNSASGAASVSNDGSPAERWLPAISRCLPGHSTGRAARSWSMAQPRRICPSPNWVNFPAAGRSSATSPAPAPSPRATRQAYSPSMATTSRRPPAS